MKIQLADFVWVVEAARKELVEFIKNEDENANTRKMNKNKLALRSLEIFSKSLKIKSGNYFRIDIPSLINLLDNPKKELVKIAQSLGIEKFNKMTVSKLKISIFKKKAVTKKQYKKQRKIQKKKKMKKRRNKVSWKKIAKIGAPWFKNPTPNVIDNNEIIHSYNDPYIIGSDLQSEIYKILIKLTNVADTAGLILEFLTTLPTQVPPLYDYEEYEKISLLEEKELERKFKIHREEDHVCNHECFNGFRHSKLYESHHFYNFPIGEWENIPEEFALTIYPIDNRTFTKTIYNKHIDNIPLVPGWYSQVVPIADGNCLKDSLFKMREMILEKYHDILNINLFGVINNEKEFTRLANALDDHDITSLKYFNFLLSTSSIYFINTKGEIIYNSKSGSSALYPSFWSCFFLIESNADGITGHISPINFGVLEKPHVPIIHTQTTIKKLYGKDSWKKYEKDILNYFFDGHATMNIELKNEDTYGGSVKRVVTKENGKDYYYYAAKTPFEDNEVKLEDYIELDKFYDLVGSSNANNMSEAAVAAFFKSFVDWGITNNNLAEEKEEDASEALQYLHQITEKITKNQAIVKGSDVGFIGNDEQPDVSLLKYMVQKMMTRATDQDKINSVIKRINQKKKGKDQLLQDFNNKSFSEQVKEGAKQLRNDLEKSLLGKKSDNAVCYSLLNLQKNQRNQADYEAILLVEYKKIGEFDLWSILQAIFYHLIQNLTSNYILISTGFNNIIFKHRIDSNNNNQHVYTLHYNDTKHLHSNKKENTPGGLNNTEILNFFGFDGDSAYSNTAKQTFESLFNEREDRLKPSGNPKIKHTAITYKNSINDIEVYDALPNDEGTPMWRWNMVKSLIIVRDIIRNECINAHKKWRGKLPKKPIRKRRKKPVGYKSYSEI